MVSLSANTSAAPGPSPALPAPRTLAFDHRILTCNAGWLKIARIHDEVWHHPPLTTAAAVTATLDAIQASALNADLFTFAQHLPDVFPSFEYHLSHDNLAIADTANFSAWWDSLPQESRKNTRKAQKRGVVIAPVAWADDLVRQIKSIYDETPVRQGRRFPHYGKDLATVKRENASYLERSHFIGATLHDELIGFIKLVTVGRSARIMQILARAAHHDKHVMNALLSAAMEHCSQQLVDHLIYGQYAYGNKRGSSVTEFKRRNGFREVLLPRYYIPFTSVGRIAIAGKLYRGLHDLLPEPVITAALNARNYACRRWARS